MRLLYWVYFFGVYLFSYRIVFAGDDKKRSADVYLVQKVALRIGTGMFSPLQKKRQATHYAIPVITVC